MGVINRRPQDLNAQAASVVTSLEADLVGLEQESANALNMFHQAIANLDNVDARIEQRITLADEHIKSLTSLKNNLASRKTSNAKVKEKILEFLS